MTDGIVDRAAEFDHLPRSELDGESDDMPMAWEGRVFAVALTWAIPGVMFGLLVGLFATLWMTGSAVVGGLTGALAGGLLEADYWS